MTFLARLACAALLVTALGAETHAGPPPVAVRLDVVPPGPRVSYGVERLKKALQDLGSEMAAPGAGREVRIGLFSELRSTLPAGTAAPAAEGFVLAAAADGTQIVAGADDSGLLYGCLELVRRAQALGRLPDAFGDAEAPALPRRVACAGRTDPDFDGSDFWPGYLDFLADNRINGLELPAEDMPDGTARASLAREADRRGIRLLPAQTTPDPIDASFEPFRYGAQRVIKAAVQTGRGRFERSGLAIVPLSPARWPWAPDRTPDPIPQYQRDWIWLEAWARYAWNPDVPAAEDRAYWTGRLGRAYGLVAAEKILAAYNDAGECAPRLVRWFGLASGGRQTLSLGVTLDEILHPAAYGSLPPAAALRPPTGESFELYAERDVAQQPHAGETPETMIREAVHSAERAVQEIDAAGPNVTSNGEEFGRLQNDIHCIREMTLAYAAKAQAAIFILRFQRSHDPYDRAKAATQLAVSLGHFRVLSQLASGAYRYANGRQTAERTIPVPGEEAGRPAAFLWSQVLPLYEKELADFQASISAVVPSR